MNTTTKTTESSDKSPPVAQYFNTTQWIIFGAIIIAGLFFRWYNLAERPLHHDESLHVMYGKYYFDNPGYGFYKYDPMLHGPLLYTTLVVAYSFLGVTEFAARFPVALMGSMYLLLPLLFRRFFSPIATLGLTAAIALSPTLIYWTRFLREDFYVLTGVFISLYGLFLAPTNRKALWFLLGFTLHLCSKENIYVHLALLVGYIIYEPLCCRLMKINESCLKGLSGHVRNNLWPLVGAIFVSAFIFSFLYGAAFQYSKGVIDILTGEPIRYWINQHNIERIQGPFLFHFYVLSWYELAFVIAVLIQAALLYRRAHWIISSIFGATVFAGLVFYLQNRGADLQQTLKNPIWNAFRVKGALDILAIPIFLIHPVLVTTEHLRRKEFSLAVTGYTFTSLLFTYSYLGEKVPWLTMYPHVAGLLYLTMFFDNYLSATRESASGKVTEFISQRLLFCIGGGIVLLAIIFMVQDQDTISPWSLVSHYFKADADVNLLWLVIGLFIALLGMADMLVDNRILPKVSLPVFLGSAGLALSLWQAVLTNVTYAGDASEYLSQVHTTREIRDLAVRVRTEVETESKGPKTNIQVDGDPTWPLTWYFRDMPQYKFEGNSSADERAAAGYRFLSWKADDPEIPGYYKRTVNLRGWWVPDFGVMTFKKFLAYALTHRPWSGVGYSYSTVYISKTPAEK